MAGRSIADEDEEWEYSMPSEGGGNAVSDDDEEWTYDTPPPVAHASPAPVSDWREATVESINRATQLTGRGVAKGLVGLADLGYSALTAWSEMGEKDPQFIGRLSGRLERAMDRHIPPPESGAERIYEAGISGLTGGGATGGTVGLLPGFMSGITSQSLAEVNAPSWLQIAGGIGAGLMTGAGQAAFRPVPGKERDIDMLLRQRDRLGAYTDDMVQRRVAADYRRAKAPFDPAFDKLRRTTIEKPIKEEILDIPASRPMEFMDVQPKSLNQQLLSVMDDPQYADVIRQDRYLRGKFADIAANQPKTVGEVMARIDRVGDDIGRSLKAGNMQRARVLMAAKKAMQDDLDTLVGGMANELRTAYGQVVKGPYSGLQGVMTGDASAFWTQFRRMSPEQKRRLAEAVSPRTRHAIQMRVVRSIAEREESFTAGQAGSGAPAWRQANNIGLGSFFDKDVWRGLQKLTSQAATMRNPSVRLGVEVTGAGVGGIFGGGFGAAAGYGTAKMLESLIGSAKGRLALASIGRMPGRIGAAEWGRINRALAVVAAQSAADADQPAEQ